MTTTETLTTYTIKMANAYFWVDYHINATTEEEARATARTMAEDGELSDAAAEEYEMAVRDDRYDPDRGDYTYRISHVEPTDGHDPRADNGPHMIKGGGNG